MAPVAPVMPTISRFGMARSLPLNALVVVFCPFAAGYFLSYFFRNVNAIISKDLAQEFALTPADLGFLTSMYLAAFAVFQLPLGVLLDRYGPRRTVAALLCLAAVGAALFALGRDLAALVALVVYFVVPEKPLPGEGQTIAAQLRSFGGVFGTVAFWRIALPMVVGQAIYLALQGLWLGPWLADVAGRARHEVANDLLITALGYIAGSVCFGVAADRLAQFGISRLTVYKLGLVTSLAMLALLAAGVHSKLELILALYAFTGISAALAYALLTPLFPPEMTGRVPTAANMLIFGVSVARQCVVVALLKLHPA